MMQLLYNIAIVIAVILVIVAVIAGIWYLFSSLFGRQFATRCMICAVPVVFAAYVVGQGYVHYQAGDGGFKLGVDLVGGTILVYEIDNERAVDSGGDATGEKRSQKLAEALKRRIDPADLYNVTIRPMGEDRVEIILPSGSIKAQARDEERYETLLGEVKENPDWKADLADAQFQTSRGSARDLPVEIVKLVDQKRWERVVATLEAKYPNLAGKLGGIEPGALPIVAERAKANGNTPTEADLKSFLDANYKPVEMSDAQAFVESRYGKQQKQNLGAGDVQHIKNLIAQQGSLEFSILANDKDDGDAVAAATAFLADPNNRARLDDLAQRGLPPDSPRGEYLVRGERATYAWVEIGPNERRTLGLMNAEESNPVNSRWSAVAAARAKGEAWLDTTMGGGEQPSRTLLYSRRCTNGRMTAAERDDKKYEYFYLCRTSDNVKVGGAVSISATSGVDERSNPAVHFRFNSVGGSQFYQVTSNNTPTPDKFYRNLAIILDGEIVSAPRLHSAIDVNGQISGNFKKEDVDRMVEILRSGTLPATLRPTPASENLISPTLGADTVASGTWAVILAFVAVLVFMIGYYRFAGLVASIALLANLIMTVGFMILVNATFTLPGLAGLVLTLGMAVDANVLIYERLREERDKGASLALAIRNGYDRAFPTIIDTHLSSIFTAIVLYAVGNDQLKGFGVSLTAGLIISLFTSLVMTRLMFDIWLAKHWLTKLSMFRFFSRPNIDFMRIRYYWFTATGILTVLGLALFLYRLAEKEGLNIDFTGGTAVTARLEEPKDIAKLRDFFTPERQKELLAVREVKQTDEDGRQFNITYASDGAVVPVQLQVRPAGATPAEHEAAIKEKASELPNTSVEQIFASDDAGAASGQSRVFTVRTSEKERVLVLVSVNRLVSEKDATGKERPVLQKVQATAANLDRFNADKRRATLTFSGPASTEYVRSVLVESLKSVGVKDRDISVTVSGEGQPKDGHYTTIALDLGASSLDPYQSVGGNELLKQAVENTVKAFNTRPQPEKLENFDSALAEETQTKAIYAIGLSWIAILLYLWFRFGSWTFGAAAVICLIHDLCFTLGLIAACHYLVVWVPGLATVLRLEDFKIDLQTVAALLTLVGYSVNDTIVVFDRIREVRGKNPALTPQMINDSVNQTLSRTILAATTVWLVVLVLYFFGGEGLHLFAFVMVIGVIVGTYSSIYVASPLLLIFGEGKPPATLTTSTARPRPVPVG